MKIVFSGLRINQTHWCIGELDMFRTTCAIVLYNRSPAGDKYLYQNQCKTRKKHLIYNNTVKSLQHSEYIRSEYKYLVNENKISTIANYHEM